MRREDGVESYPIRIADEFITSLAGITSERLIERIRRGVELLETFPELGAAEVRPYLAKKYGPDIRKLAISTWVLVYRFDGVTVDVLALVYGPQVK